MRAEYTQVCVTQHVFSPNYAKEANGSELSNSFRTATGTNLTSITNRPLRASLAAGRLMSELTKLEREARFELNTSNGWPLLIFYDPHLSY